MNNSYQQSVNTARTHFTDVPLNELEFSTMSTSSHHLTTFNGGDIVPIYCQEVLPHDTFKMDINFVIRQTTSLVPVMGQLNVDFYAFFVPNRIINNSWKAVQGENTSGSWYAPEVTLATLAMETGTMSSTWNSVQVPVGSVADYYGYPTQRALSRTLLQQMHDLKFRGYLSIYNNYFRDQNYEAPIPFSKMNVYEGFFEPLGTAITFKGGQTSTSTSLSLQTNTPADGSIWEGAVANALYGDGVTPGGYAGFAWRKTSFSALAAPLKANKLHDYFTSVLPSPQKGRQVVIPLSGFAPLDTNGNVVHSFTNNAKLLYSGQAQGDGYYALGIRGASNSTTYRDIVAVDQSSTTPTMYNVTGSNLGIDLTDANISVSVYDMRFNSALQQVYELLGRGGSRYVEFISSFFGLEVENPFDDIPLFLGHFRRDLDLYQTAQTSASVSSGSGASTPQGNLSAFGYTAKDGSLFHKTFNEHGYIHVFAVVRHRNVYSSFLSRDNFRLSQMDFYLPQLANISEQPVYTREINPFGGSDDVFGYQEAWAEYRYEPDRVSGYMRTGVTDTLAYWNYADDFSSSLNVADSSFMKSNTENIVSRSTATQDRSYPQFKGDFTFNIVKERPMPVYSVPGMDIF